MGRTVGIGWQDYATVIENNCFYVDKTDFIRQWWRENDAVTMITRPRRFGKTLNMSMVNCFFSLAYKGRDDLFRAYSVWQDEELRGLQGTMPTLFLSFAGVKETSLAAAKHRINHVIARLYNQYEWMLKEPIFTDADRAYFHRVNDDMPDELAVVSLQLLCEWLSQYYHRQVLILLDEYDTPMLEAYVHGYWDGLASYMRNLFNNTFKTNTALARALMTGITRISRESIFSDLNNLRVITTTSETYADCFGFTEEEVFAAMDEMGLTDKDLVKEWYDGFTFGHLKGIYNPWSIINYLSNERIDTWWANTSSNALISRLLREGDGSLKEQLEDLLAGNTITARIDEEIVFDQLRGSGDAIWSLLLAGGYLRVISFESRTEAGVRRPQYVLALTNREVMASFDSMISLWFEASEGSCGRFQQAMLRNDLDAMNHYMNEIALKTFSSFDTGAGREGGEPERFYHGFVLGLMVELADRYEVISNRESGFGRYDVMLRPRDRSGNGYILEFKVFRPEREKDLAETVAAAKRQIDERKYETALLEAGCAPQRIFKYGFAFAGRRVLIG